MSEFVKRIRFLAAGQDDPQSIALSECADRIEALEKALQAMLHAVCHETGFAAAVRADSGKAYPWVTLDAAEEQARAALEGNDE